MLYYTVQVMLLSPWAGYSRDTHGCTCNECLCMLHVAPQSLMEPKSATFQNVQVCLRLFKGNNNLAPSFANRHTTLAHLYNQAGWLKVQILFCILLQHYMQHRNVVILTCVQDLQDEPHGSKACNAACSTIWKVELLQYRF